jgi:hypothetical protein
MCCSTIGCRKHTHAKLRILYRAGLKKLARTWAGVPVRALTCRLHRGLFTGVVKPYPVSSLDPQ